MNPQANGLVEWIHLTMSNSIRCHTFREDWNTDLATLLQSVAWAIRATVSSVTGKSPSDLLYGRDMIFPIHVQSTWNNVVNLRIKDSEKSRDKENSKLIFYPYRVWEQVLLIKQGKVPKTSTPTSGPYKIMAINNARGLINIDRNSYREWVSLRRVKPFKKKIQQNN